MNDARSGPKAISAIGEGFRSRFEVIPALTDTLKDQTYRMRHSVYSEDLGFEALRPDGREVDEYDDYATGLLIRHVPSGEFIGCARLIRPRLGALNDTLPFELTCAGALDRELIEANPVPRHRIAEISRLAIISKFRRRKGEAQSPAPLEESAFGSGPIPRFPYVLLGLYLGIVALGEHQGVEKLFLLTEPRLAAHLLKIGFEIQQVGGPVEHRGVRVLSMAIVARVIQGLNPQLRPIYDTVQPQIQEAYSMVEAL